MWIKYWIGYLIIQFFLIQIGRTLNNKQMKEKKIILPTLRVSVYKSMGMDTWCEVFTKKSKDDIALIHWAVDTVKACKKIDSSREYRAEWESPPHGMFKEIYSS